MTIVFSAFTVLALVFVAIFTYLTGMAATSYFILATVMGAYLLWYGCKQYILSPIKQGK